VDELGPDAQGITLREFRAALARGRTAPVKARLLDQSAVAGIGNLLADQALWLARVNPARPVGELSAAEVQRLHRAVRRSVDRATAGGGVHTLSLLGSRRAGAVCPRDGAPMVRGTVGGRTTWWCSREQA
jgi:formamidopyrimidine-DNA glycosylase